MTLTQEIQDCLQRNYHPSFLNVENESGMHNVPKGSESHFKVIVASPVFDGLGLLARHRHVQTSLGPLMQRLHALALHTYTPGEWEKKNLAAPDSPLCRGGEK